MDPPLTVSPQLNTQDRFELLLDAACDYAIFFTDIHSGITEWSHGAEKILGFSEAEALQLHGRDIFTPEDLEQGVPEKEVETAKREGQADDERWHMRKDGTRFFAVGRLVALRDNEGRLYGFAKILRDVTEQKKLEQALRASDQQFRTTFAQAPVGMVLTDLDGRIQRANAAFCRLSEVTEIEAVGRELFSFTTPEDREKAWPLIQEMRKGRRDNAVLEKQLQKTDGSLVWVQNSASLLRDADGRPLCFIDLFQDISALKLSASELEDIVRQRTASLIEKSKQMEAFCYTVAHDLRAPLRAIAGFSELLCQDFGSHLPGEGLDYLHTIQTSAGRLDRLISDLLGYTRVQQVTLAKVEVDLGAIVQRIVDQLKQESRVEGLVFDLVAPLGKARADDVTLEHVLLNLISNAVKFRRPGVAPVIRVYSEEKGERLRVWVEDNGIGIDPRFKDRVFGMFERLHPQREIPGTGVGLAIVATAMERLGGSRGVEPNVPFGSRFWIEFPK